MPLLVCTFRLLRDRTPVTMARTFLSLDFLSKLFKASTRNFESYVISESDCLRSHRLSVVIHLIPIRRIVYDLIPSHSFPIASLSDSPYSILFIPFSRLHWILSSLPSTELAELTRFTRKKMIDLNLAISINHLEASRASRANRSDRSTH